MAKENLETIDLNEKTDLMAIRTECPQCGDKYMYAVPHVTVPCRKCGITYKTDFRQDIYTKKGRYIEDKKAEKDGIIFRATESYKPALIHIRYNHIEQKCWDVSEIEQTREEFRHCLKCGYCLNCFTCKECGTTFEKDKKIRHRRCPKCKKSNFTRTYFKEAKTKEGQTARFCPECESDNIKSTLTRNKSRCHLCGSKKLSQTKINNIYTLTIKSKGGYRK